MLYFGRLYDFIHHIKILRYVGLYFAAQLNLCVNVRHTVDDFCVKLLLM